MTERRKQVIERRRDIAVGLTALAGLVGLAVLLTAFGYTPAFMRGGYEVTLYLDNAAGLHKSSRVTLAGLDIGHIEEVGLNTSDHPGKAYARLLIRDDVAIPESVDVRIETPLFGGGPVISLVEREGGRVGITLPSDGTATLTDATIVDPLVQLEVVSTDIGELKDTWVQVGDNINMLFGAEDSDQPNLPRVVMGMEQRLAQLEEVLAGIDSWVNNPQLREDITQTAANMRELTEQLSASVQSLEERYAALALAAQDTLGNADAVIGEIGQSMSALEKRYLALADDAAATAATIDELLARAASDESSLGLLLSDPQLYHNLNDSAERLRLMIDESRLLVEKWKAEGVPLRVFK